MFNKKFFLVAAWYLAGGLVSSLYNKKKPTELREEMKEWKENGQWEMKVLLANFVDIHKNLIYDVEKEIMSDKNKALFQVKKAQLLEIADMYKVEGNRLLEELKQNGKWYLLEASDQLENLYNEKKWELNELKDISPEKVKELKNNLLATFEEMKNKMSEQFTNKEENSQENK